MKIRSTLLYIIGLCAIVYLVTLIERILPESSFVALGAINVNNNLDCINCHVNTDKVIAANSCLDNIKPVSHILYQGKCDELLAYFEAQKIKALFEKRAKTAFSNPLMEGERLARKYYCFQCHGELGQGGYPNQGALKGYIPGYFGQDFKQLTNNASLKSIERWIRFGVDQDLLDLPIEGFFAKHFLTNQTIQMPHFKSLSNSDISTLANYLRLLNLFGPMTASDIKKYGELSEQELNIEQLINNIKK